MHKLLCPIAIIVMGFGLLIQSAQAEPSRDEVTEVRDLLEKIHRYRTPTTRVLAGGGDAEAIAMAEAELAKFRSEVEAAMTPQVIANARDTSSRSIQSLHRRAGRLAGQLGTSIGSIDVEQVTTRSSGAGYAGRFTQLIFDVEKIRMLSRLFGENAEFAAALEQTRPVMAVFGDSFDEAGAKAEERELQLAGQRRLRPSRQSNSALVTQFWNALRGNAMVESEIRDARRLKTNLIDSGWTVERNPVTGIIVSRYQRADFALQTSDGKCHIFPALFEQKATGGGGYGNIYYRSGVPRAMLCENI